MLKNWFAFWYFLYFLCFFLVAFLCFLCFLRIICFLCFLCFLYFLCFLCFLCFFVRVRSFCKKKKIKNNEKVWNCPNDLIYITTSKIKKITKSTITPQSYQIKLTGIYTFHLICYLMLLRNMKWVEIVKLRMRNIEKE